MYFVFVKSICWILFVLYNKLNFYYYLIKCLLRNCNFDVKMIGLDLTNRERWTEQTIQESLIGSVRGKFPIETNHWTFELAVLDDTFYNS